MKNEGVNLESPSSEFRHSNFRARRGAGFTLIELLVVIGIILVLIGLFLGGLKHVTQQARERDTRANLDLCRTMYDNYKQQLHSSRIPRGLYSDSSSPGIAVEAYPSFDFWGQGQELAPGVLSSDSLTYKNTAPVAFKNPNDGSKPDQIIANTILVMAAIESVPSNRDLISNLPFAKTIPAQIDDPLGSTTPVPATLMKDSWDHPILFVPAGGLVGVWVDPPNSQPSPNETQVIINGSGTTSAGAKSVAGHVQPNGYDLTTPALSALTVDNQPFFVSAGADGDVSNAHGWTSGTTNSGMTDDNMYSFQ